MYIFTFNQTSYFEGLLWSFKLVVCMCVTFTKISKIKKLTIIDNFNSICMEFSVSVAFFWFASVRVYKLSFMWFNNYFFFWLLISPIISKRIELSILTSVTDWWTHDDNWLTSESQISISFQHMFSMNYKQNHFKYLADLS